MNEFLETAKHTIPLAASSFSDDELMTRATVLAFSSALSFAPLLLLLIWVFVLVFGAMYKALPDAIVEWNDVRQPDQGTGMGARAA
jgi:membrane protein